MLRYFLDKAKNIVVSLRFSILSIFISLFVFAMLIAIGVTSYRFSETISYVAMQFMKEASSAVFDDLSNELRDVAIECQFAAHLIYEGTINPNNLASVTEYTFDLMTIEAQSLPSVQTAFWGDEQGNFVLSGKNNDNTVTSEIINRSVSPATQMYIYRDAQRKIIGTVNSNDLSYEPRQRPWYTAAKAAGKLIWTDVFRYRLTEYLGITAAMPVYKKDGTFEGVFALNIRLDYLRHFIETLKISDNSVVYLLTQEGKIISFPNLPQYHKTALMDIHELPQKWLIESFDNYKKLHKEEFVYEYQNKTYLAVYKPIPIVVGHGWLIGVVGPESDFIGRLIKTNIITITISLIILVIGIVLMSMLVNRIVNPMKKLVKETERIKHFKLHETQKIHSQIKEVIKLSDGIYAMKKGLRSFRKYVPATLVRQLIEAGRDVIIGGEKKPLAILFSDIKDFTAISEKMDPQKLMEYVCEYFNVLSHVISEHKGTIDKYIGDSIMVFWGAPLPEANPCEQAAHAALECQRSLREFNNEAIAHGRMPLYTRIGLHFGEAIVGNLGSNERLNYTAIGDAINMTSRLEGANKIYNTQIIVSEAFYNEIKNQFILRMIDCIAVKGKTQGTFVYELMAEDRNQLTFDFEGYEQEYALGFSEYQKGLWDKAILHFKECLVIFPDDTIAKVLMARCEELKRNPPLNWDGVWRLQEK